MGYEWILWYIRIIYQKTYRIYYYISTIINVYSQTSYFDIF